MEKKEKSEKMINVGEKLTENIKMKRIIKKRYLKKKEDFNMMMFDVVNVKNSNAIIFIKYYINDTTSISSSFRKFFFEFENFLKEKDATQTQKKKKKKEKNSKKDENESFEKAKKKEINK